MAGMDASLMGRMKELEAENARLKKMYADVQLQNDVIKEAMAKKVVRPSLRRVMAKGAVGVRRLSIRAACDAFTIRKPLSKTKLQLMELNAAKNPPKSCY